jgi:hypothetical protein
MPGTPVTVLVDVLEYFEPENLGEAAALPFAPEPHPTDLLAAWKRYHHGRDRGCN